MTPFLKEKDIKSVLDNYDPTKAYRAKNPKEKIWGREYFAKKIEPLVIRKETGELYLAADFQLGGFWGPHDVFSYYSVDIKGDTLLPEVHLDNIINTYIFIGRRWDSSDSKRIFYSSGLRVGMSVIEYDDLDEYYLAFEELIKYDAATEREFCSLHLFHNQEPYYVIDNIGDCRDIEIKYPETIYFTRC